MYSNTDESCGFTALWTACKQKVKLKSTFFLEEVRCLHYVAVSEPLLLYMST